MYNTTSTFAQKLRTGPYAGAKANAVADVMTGVRQIMIMNIRIRGSGLSPYSLTTYTLTN